MIQTLDGTREKQHHRAVPTGIRDRYGNGKKLINHRTMQYDISDLLKNIVL